MEEEESSDSVDEELLDSSDSLEEELVEESLVSSSSLELWETGNGVLLGVGDGVLLGELEGEFVEDGLGVADESNK